MSKFIVDGRVGHLDNERASNVKSFSAAKKKDAPQEKANVKTVQQLMTDLGISVRFNELSGQLDISGMPKRYSRTNAVNTLPAFLLDVARTQGIRANRQLIDDAILMTGDECRFHPVRDMLTGESWDGQPRVGVVLDALHLPPDSFDALLVRRWLHQTVALALNDEAEPYGGDGVLVFQGAQGLGKTQFFRLLACRSDWFAEGCSIDTDRVDSVIQATGVWIAELGELDSTLRREQAALKAFLTSSTDTFRAPYARAAAKRPRRTSFAATVNPESFINDDSGSRRFWTVHLNAIDLDMLFRLDRDWFFQLWREVYTTDFLPNPQGFRLSLDERSKLASRNQTFDKPLPYELELMEALDWDNPFVEWRWWSVRDIKPLVGSFNPSAEQIGRALKKICDRMPKATIRNSHGIKKFYLPPALK